jgi:hypothetical protein
MPSGERAASEEIGLEFYQELDRMLDQMVEHQRGKVLESARRKNPTLTSEDIMNPEGFPEIYGDGPFNYEDGILNGMLTAQMAIRSLIRRRLEK